MSVEVFIERARPGKVFYELRETQLQVSGQRFLQKFSRTVELHAMSPRVEHLSQRFWRPILVCIGIGSVMLATTIAFIAQKVLPLEAVMYYAEASGIFGAIFLGAGIHWIPRLEVVRFKNVVGRTVFNLIRERSQAAEADAFVQLLQRRIVESRANITANAPRA